MWKRPNKTTHEWGSARRNYSSFNNISARALNMDRELFKV